MSAASYLFVPANRTDRYAKALDSGADAVIVDLEDAVGPQLKDEARAALAGWLRHNGAQPRLWVRVNAADTAWHEADVAAFAGMDIAGIVLPKAEHPAAVAAIARRLKEHRQGVIALIETAAGIAAMRDIARTAGVARLAFGSIDLQVDLGMQCDAIESELAHLRVEMVLASRLAGIAPPIDGVTTTFDGMPFLAAAVQRSLRLGFGAKLCIHPRQVAAVNAGFRPTAGELAWAKAVMAAVDKSDGGAISLDGKMIDKPVILQAQRFLQRGGVV
ncbi:MULTISPECIES: CoA ester lyase [unclassified Herbaspirillum]|uniref:HpcH/HpaI aldolase/citrate lyase family protein n=1 Tax=unclassified Herbaspirillum TaxID=2624150 RepID=UPI00114E28F5|nr:MULTISPECIES: CoA ester lyase [unclassified Herbaspirillum]MBB5393513.1 citrate lyase subunit beta/citryl-CoA lyase [Herbaspirillum sp. SJZ102]